jgi:hypothetical protein
MKILFFKYIFPYSPVPTDYKKKKDTDKISTPFTKPFIPFNKDILPTTSWPLNLQA